MTFLQALQLGWVVNALVAAPFYFLVERHVPRDREEENTALLGTVALCLVPWLYAALHVPVVVGGLSVFALSKLRGR